MNGIIDAAVKVFNNQIQFLRTKSLAFEQETRVSFYTFNNTVQNVISDVDVARPMTLDNISADGGTALMDSIALAIKDSKLISQKYGDHSFFIYAITDGYENQSRIKAAEFKRLVQSLPDNYTLVAFVPDNNGKTILEGLGVAKDNIDKWDTTERGIEEVGRKFEATIDAYFTGRTKGVRSSKTVFTDLKQVTAKNVGKILDKLSKAKYKIIINEALKAVQIKPLVEDKLGMTYTKGCAYYELCKNEHVQASKEIAIQNKKTGDVYTGDNARQLLNLPDQEVKVVPGDFGEWIVYVQSTSVNRNVIPKQRVLVLK